MNEPETAEPKPGKKERKRQKFVPYKVRLGTKVFWQVNLESELVKRADGSVVRVRPRRTFSNAEEARTFADLKRVERANRGTLGVSMDDRLRADAMEASELLRPYRATLVDAALEYIHRRERLTKSQSVAQAIMSLLEAKSADHLRPRYLKDLRNRLSRFALEFGERLVADISSGEIDQWLRELGLGALSRNTFRAGLSVFFEYARGRGWTEANPVSAVRKTKVHETLPGILSPDQIARLLENADSQTLPYWALGLFCGLRTAELERLSWADVHFEENVVEVPSLASKTASRRFVPIRENVARWLEPYRNMHGALCPPNLRTRLETDRAKAGIITWPSNAARHSFGSYHLAAFQNAALCASEMGHTSAAVTYRFYNQRVRPTVAHEFWRIVPAIATGPKLAAIA